MQAFYGTAIISIHSLRMEGDSPHTQRRSMWTISIHSLRMEGDKRRAGELDRQSISIHSLRMEGDYISREFGRRLGAFQSTPSAWRETQLERDEEAAQDISIHSLRMEGDSCEWRLPLCESYFNPLPPHGGRPMLRNHPGKVTVFQSTPSAWRETASQASLTNSHPFQSTPSAWRETAAGRAAARNFDISIHSLRMEGDVMLW